MLNITIFCQTYSLICSLSNSTVLLSDTSEKKLKAASGGNIIWRNFFAQRNKRQDKAALMRSLHERNGNR
jgi:hypothetical protein